MDSVHWMNERTLCQPKMWGNVRVQKIRLSKREEADFISDYS
jgi:hypothetical protein